MSPFRRLLQRAFEAGLFLKGVLAFVELASGIALFFVAPSAIPRFVHCITSAEIAEDPTDLVARYLLAATQSFSLDAQNFFAIYLSAHGAVKLILVVLLARERLWAYPVAIAVFAGFVAYQLHRYMMTPSLALIVLSLVDIGIIVLTYIELKRLKNAGQR